MKRTLLSLFLLSMLFTATSFVAGGSEITIKVSKGTIAVNKKKVAPDWKVSTYKSVLGEPSRTRDGYNKTHTYDDYGMVLFEPMKDKVPAGIISEYQIYFNLPEANEVTPKGTYGGAMKIDKLNVTGSLTATTMLAKLKGWQKTDSYMEHSYRMAKGGLYIYFQFNDSETSLIKVSIGPDKKGTSK